MDNYHLFIDTLVPKFEHIYVIAGNHEFYNARHDYVSTLNYMKSYFDEKDNITFLHDESVIVDGVRLIGTTLWSHVPFDQMYMMRQAMNDYKKITQPYDPRIGHGRLPIAPGHTNLWHDNAVKFITSELEIDPITPTVVLSHHVPYNSKDFIPLKFQTSDYEIYNSAYYSDQSKLFKRPITHWLFGHCHYKIEYNFVDPDTKHTMVLGSNPMGYPGETSGYDVNYLIETECLANMSVIEVKK
jgi:DNA repair exonuclease SbcCD nuclease subunit